MKINKNIKNRFNVLYIVLAFVTFSLVFNLAKLTVLEGDRFREEADVKIVKDIPVKAPRGKILDRNGEILADNLTSFTVQLFKDKIKRNQLNSIAYRLSSILSENGEKFIDDFPILIDCLEYADANKIYDKTPNEYAIELLSSENNIENWLNGKYIIDGIEIKVKKIVYYSLLHKKNELIVSYKDNMFKFNISEEKLKEIYAENEYAEDFTAEDYVIEILKNDNSQLERLIYDSRIRCTVYSYLTEKNITEELILTEFCFEQDDSYINLKKYLASQYEGISLETDAKDDFIYLVKYEVLDKLFQNYYKDGDNIIIPAQNFLNVIADKYQNIPFKVDIIDDSLKFMYNGNGYKDDFLKNFMLADDASAYDLFRAVMLKENKYLDEIITSDEIKIYAQSELLSKGINPLISVSTWEYRYLREKRYWVERNLDDNAELTAEEVFNDLRESLGLNENEYAELSNFDIRNIMVISERYNANSYLSYHPIDICYDVLDRTVAMISETSYDLKGVNIEIEPVRYYPNGDSAAHILGYLGKISSDSEIKRYIDENGYSGQDIIGKTGIEEKFEDYLHGEKGSKTVTVNANGSAINSVSEKNPVPGDTLYTTIDLNIQKKVEEVLDKGLKCIQTGTTYESEWGRYPFKDAYKNAKSGAMVVLDVKEGEVLALANYPSYDLNLFARGISTDNWNTLLNDSKDQIAPRPLYNIALLSAIQPGSTFKMVTALAALEKGVNPLDKIYCSGYMNIGLRKFGCWIYNMFGRSHGNQNLYEAIKNSCNYYFFTSMLGENPQTGKKHTIKLDFEDVTNMAKNLGLDDPTGIEIDIPKESYGTVPSIEAKKSTMKLYLSIFLKNDLIHYVKEGYDMDEVELSESIVKICSWIDKDELMSRNQVANALVNLNFDPYKTYESHVPIVDIIKYTYINDSVWNVGDSLNLSIGQGDNAYTPIQMANYIATIANGGYLRNISVIDKAVSYDGKISYQGERSAKRIDLADYDYLNEIKIGMKLVAEDAYVFKNFPIDVGVKTGTAEKDGINPETGELYDNYAWYVAFAPYDDPEIAVACLVFQGGSGLYPQPMVRDVIAEYFAAKGIIERPKIEE